jgi:hypothetical protein
VKVGLALYIEEEIDRLSAVVARIDQRLSEFFETRTYGGDVQVIFIGLILMGPGSERLHRVRPLKYRREYTLSNRELNLKEYLGNVVEFDLKPDYLSVRTLNSEDAERYITGSLIEGLSELVAHQRKFPDFDLAGFREDFCSCLTPPPSQS